MSSGSPRARPSPVEWLYLLVGGVLVQRYFFLYDDAFVYFRYVDNLLFARLGLVYNQGEYVEGYSSPLWTLILIPLRASGLDWITLLRGLALVGWAAAWWMLVRLDRLMAPQGPRVNLPAAFLCTSYAFLSWSSSGLETLALQLAAILCALFVARPGSRGLQVLVALAPLARHELLPSLALGVLWARWRTGRWPRPMLAAAGIALGAWQLFRMGYYADLLPNTFYLKDASDWGQGLVYLRDTFATYRIHWLAGLLAVLCVLAARGGRLHAGVERLAMLALALPVVLYVARIGGAPIHYRYLAFPFTLALAAGSGILEAALAPIAGSRKRWLAPAAGLLVAGLSSSAYPRQLDRHPLRAGIVVGYEDKILEAEYHRAKGRGDWKGWPQRVSAERIAGWWREHPDGYAKTELASWCINAYVAYTSRIVHAFGLTDAVLARARVPASRPGHKPRLIEMAREVVLVHERAGPPGRGMYRRAVEQGVAADWIARNLDAIEAIERRVYNPGAWWRNVSTALHWSGRYVP